MGKENTRSRKYLLTINNPDKHEGCDHKSIFEKASKFQTIYMAVCDETGGKEGTFHTHAYLHFENGIRFSTIKRLFPTANIAAAKGTSQQNRHYLLKDLPEHGKNAEGFYNYTDKSGKTHCGQNFADSFKEYGECPEENQGERSDLEQLYSLVKEGYSDAEILEIMPETAIPHIDRISKLRLTYLTDKYKGNRRFNLKVHYITGKTGTGKSRDILDEFGDENVYRVTEYKHPFDSYQCEPVLVFEEYRASIRLQDMLNYLDIYPIILPARYSPKVGCYSTVFVVSNWTFEQQYAEIQKEKEQKPSYEAWVRRFNGYVKEYYAMGKYHFYPTMQDYLKRHEAFHPIADKETPFAKPDGKQMSLPDIPEQKDCKDEPTPFS